MSDRSDRGTRFHCVVEERLTESQTLELDMLLADPGRWPAAIFDGWSLPRGSLPATMRTWGAVEVGLNFMADHGHTDIKRRQMQNHYEKHVPILPASPDDIVASGAPNGPSTRPTSLIPSSPTSYQEMYQKGLAVGGRALDLLMDRLERMAESGEKIPTALLMDVAKLGSKFATSQAGIVAKGIDINREKEEELEGFRAGSAPAPSERFGDHRIRVIEGEARPIVDRGPSDRREYNKRAEQDASPKLPA